MDPVLILLPLLAVMIFFMFRSNRKRQRESQEMQAGLRRGAKVMTSSGIFGTIAQVDQTENQVLLETTPGTVLTVHTQAINRIITPSDEPEPELDDGAAEPAGDGVSTTGAAVLNGDPVQSDGSPDEHAASRPADDSEPEFGKRITPGDDPK